MEKVVATVSGFHGTERFELIKLITLSGANYVGVMSPSITHLVCAKLEGNKFHLAQKLKIFIVSHLWFQDCLKARKRIPEKPYILRSGHQIPRLRLDGLLPTPLTHRPRNVLIDLSNDSQETRVKTGGGSSQCTWSPSPLIDELLLQKSYPKSSAKIKRKAAMKPIEDEECLLTRYFQDSSSSSSSSSSFGVRMEGESSSRYATRSVRRKKDTCSAVNNTTIAETSCKGRRLLKRNTTVNILVYDLSDSERAYDSVETRYPHPTIRPQSSRPDSRNFPLGLHGGGGTVDSSEEIREINDFNQTNYSSGGFNLCGDDGSKNVEGTESFDAGASLSGVLENEDQNENMTKLTSSMELSCVICWTDFSSTRGVLPCGHRFCYTCIQNWADHMASMGKMSTCPLCKANFVSITKFDDADTFDQKIYSQTIPYAASTSDVYVLPYREPTRIGALSSLTAVCSVCQYREPEDLLISCHGCRIRCIHSYCLDPPLLPWTCFHCKDRRTLFNQFR